MVGVVASILDKGMKTLGVRTLKSGIKACGKFSCRGQHSAVFPELGAAFKPVYLLRIHVAGPPALLDQPKTLEKKCEQH
jgi:hypothetical protein